MEIPEQLTLDTSCCLRQVVNDLADDSEAMLRHSAFVLGIAQFRCGRWVVILHQPFSERGDHPTRGACSHSLDSPILYLLD